MSPSACFPISVNPKERELEFRRTVFTHDDWVAHRSTFRYFRHARGLVGSRIVRALLTPMMVVFLVSLLVCFYETLRRDPSVGVVPVWLPSFALDNIEPFQITVFAISLLLVFRTRESYTRWAEARRIWGGILNRSRDLARQIFTMMKEDQDELRKAMLRWSIACPFAMKSHLRRVSALDTDLKDVLRHQELQMLLAVDHRPNFTMSMMSEIAKRANLEPVQGLAIDQNLTFLADAIGGCERIFKTPIPLSYTRHTSRFLLIFLLYLPFQLWHNCKWGLIPTTLITAFLLLGIDEIGVMIEEPFSILALEVICDTAKKNMLEIADRQKQAGAFLDRAFCSLTEGAEDKGDSPHKQLKQRAFSLPHNATSVLSRTLKRQITPIDLLTGTQEAVLAAEKPKTDASTSSYADTREERIGRRFTPSAVTGDAARVLRNDSAWALV